MNQFYYGIIHTIYVFLLLLTLSLYWPYHCLDLIIVLALSLSWPYHCIGSSTLDLIIVLALSWFFHFWSWHCLGIVLVLPLLILTLSYYCLGLFFHCFGLFFSLFWVVLGCLGLFFFHGSPYCKSTPKKLEPVARIQRGAPCVLCVAWCFVLSTRGCPTAATCLARAATRDQCKYFW